MRGKVRNWAYLVRGKPSFTRKMQPDPDSTGSRFGKAGSTTGAVAGSLIAPAPEAAPPTARPEPAPAPTAQLGARLRPVDVDPFEGAPAQADSPVVFNLRLGDGIAPKAIAHEPLKPLAAPLAAISTPDDEDPT